MSRTREELDKQAASSQGEQSVLRENLDSQTSVIHQCTERIQVPTTPSVSSVSDLAILRKGNISQSGAWVLLSGVLVHDGYLFEKQQ